MWGMSPGHSRRGEIGAMLTLEQLEQRVHDLERQVAELRGELKPLRPLASVQDTFGMFA